MWPKDDYQEHLLGYLGQLQNDIEQLACSRLPQHELNILYTDLNLSLNHLWILIEARDDEWEHCRYALEASCDRLLHAINHMPSAGSAITSTSLAILDVVLSRAERRDAVELVR
jgi:hypothetical protein